jgi:hypothetical protein
MIFNCDNPIWNTVVWSSIVINKVLPTVHRLPWKNKALAYLCWRSLFHKTLMMWILMRKGLHPPTATQPYWYYCLWDFLLQPVPSAWLLAACARGVRVRRWFCIIIYTYVHMYVFVCLYCCIQRSQVILHYNIYVCVSIKDTSEFCIILYIYIYISIAPFTKIQVILHYNIYICFH